jgi:hypothetical protein
MKNPVLRLALVLALTGTSVCAETAPFLRKTTLTNGTVQLETCIRRYQPAEGKSPVVYLTSVAHVGETNYFAALQKHLDAQRLVMFEGVRGAETGIRASRTNRSTTTTNGPALDPTALQTKLAEALGLVFQLDALDYARTNFRNNDIALSNLTAKLRGQSIDGDKLMHMLGGQDDLLKPLLMFLSGDAASRALVKTVLVELLADLGNDFGALAALSPDLGKLLKVLLADRNEAIFANLKAELAKPDAPSTIAMFYGAAHMKELAERLEGELHYRVADEQWLPAFGVNPQAAGINEQQLAMVRAALQMIRQMKAPAAVQEKEAGK